MQIGDGHTKLEKPKIATLETLGIHLSALMQPRAQKIASLKEQIPSTRVLMVSRVLEILFPLAL